MEDTLAMGKFDRLGCYGWYDQFQFLSMVTGAHGQHTAFAQCHVEVGIKDELEFVTTLLPNMVDESVKEDDWRTEGVMNDHAKVLIH